MHRNARASVATLCAVLCLATAGCSDDSDSDDDRLDLSDSPSASSSETARDDSSDGSGAAEIPTTYRSVGLEFTKLPEATGAKREALETYVAYERGQRQLSRTAKLNPLITDNAAPSVVDVMTSTVAHLTSTDTRYSGIARISVDFDGFSARQAVLSLCTDATDLSLVTKGQKRPVEGRERVRGRATLSSTGGAWTLTDYTTLDESC